MWKSERLNILLSKVFIKAGFKFGIFFSQEQKTNFYITVSHTVMQYTETPYDFFFYEDQFLVVRFNHVNGNFGLTWQINLVYKVKFYKELILYFTTKTV